MRHSKIKKLVSEYIDGELKKDLEFVERHIKSCDECSQLVKIHELTRETLKGNLVETSPYLFTRIKARMERAREQQSILDYVINFSREIAIALILLIFILIGMELISSKTSLKIDEVLLTETSSLRKIISSNENLSKDEILELTLSNGEKK